MEVRRVQDLPLVLTPVIVRLRGGGERHRSGTQMMQDWPELGP